MALAALNLSISGRLRKSQTTSKGLISIWSPSSRQKSPVPGSKGRLADLAWLLRTPSDPKYALIAINAHRKVPLDIETWLRDGREC
jgi:hypothetical protein